MIFQNIPVTPSTCSCKTKQYKPKLSGINPFPIKTFGKKQNQVPNFHVPLCNAKISYQDLLHYLRDCKVQWTLHYFAISQKTPSWDIWGVAKKYMKILDLILLPARSLGCQKMDWFWIQICFNYIRSGEIKIWYRNLYLCISLRYISSCRSKTTQK